jgi:hypothetical protein
MPKRIQRKRTAGWRKPEGAVFVGRPTKWGNPFTVDPDCCSRTMHFFRQQAVDQYRLWIADQSELHKAIRDQLAGRDLMCWCPFDQPCHADVLLEIVNN